MRTIITIFMLLLVHISPLAADQLFLVNGDRLTGTLQQLTDGKLSFKSNLAGDIIVDVKNVQSLATDAPVLLRLQDGSTIKAQLAIADPGQLVLQQGTVLEAQTIALAEVTAINPPKPKWHGNIRAGYTISRGNSETEDANAGFDLQRRTDNDRITAAGAYFFSREKDNDTGDRDTTKDEWFARLQYDYFWNPQLYVYGNTRVERDSIADLDLRLMAGSGIGYQWFETTRFSLSTEAGLGWQYEVFEDDENNEQVSARLAYRIARQINQRLRMFHDTEYYVSVEDLSDYYLISQAGLQVTLIQSLFIETRAVVKHDSTPADDAEQTDFTYMFSLGWNF